MRILGCMTDAATRVTRLFANNRRVLGSLKDFDVSAMDDALNRLEGRSIARIQVFVYERGMPLASIFAAVMLLTGDQQPLTFFASDLIDIFVSKNEFYPSLAQIDDPVVAVFLGHSEAKNRRLGEGCPQQRRLRFEGFGGSERAGAWLCRSIIHFYR